MVVTYKSRGNIVNAASSAATTIGVPVPTAAAGDYGIIDVYTVASSAVLPAPGLAWAHAMTIPDGSGGARHIYWRWYSGAVSGTTLTFTIPTGGAYGRAVMTAGATTGPPTIVSNQNTTPVNYWLSGAITTATPRYAHNFNLIYGPDSAGSVITQGDIVATSVAHFLDTVTFGTGVNYRLHSSSSTITRSNGGAIRGALGSSYNSWVISVMPPEIPHDPVPISIRRRLGGSLITYLGASLRVAGVVESVAGGGVRRAGVTVPFVEQVPPVPWLNRAYTTLPPSETTVQEFDPALTPNGTNEYFSPTAGRLLVAIAVSPSIMSTPSGWTLGTARVNSLCLYVWWKIATGGDILTIEHDFPNILTGAAIYEFAAGSVLSTSTNGIGSASAPHPSLTGLPGTSNTQVFAATSTYLDNNALGVVDARAAWSGGPGAIEDFDFYEVGLTFGDPGFQFSAAYANDFTGSAWTPLADITLVEITPVDKEMVSFAITTP